MKAVIYARFSSEKQNEASIEGQLRECMEYAEFNNIQVVGNYIDRAQSAKTDHRPKFQHMIKDSYKNLFDTVLVWKLDRFARNRYDSAYYKNVLKRTALGLSPQRKPYRRARKESCSKVFWKAMQSSIRRNFPRKSNAV